MTAPPKWVTHCANILADVNDVVYFLVVMPLTLICAMGLLGLIGSHEVEGIIGTLFHPLALALELSYVLFYAVVKVANAQFRRPKNDGCQ